MRRAGGRVGGWALAAAAALSPAFTLCRLTAQSQPSITSLIASTRSAGLAGAGVALVGDAGSMFANPAGLATIRGFALEGSYARYPAEATLSSAAAAVRLGHFNYGLAGVIRRPDTATTQPDDLLALTSVVFRFGMIALGGSVKYVREGAAIPQTESWAGDVGVAIALFDILALGASVENLGGDLSAGAHLPHRTRVGLTMNFVDPQGKARLRTTLEGQWPEGQSSVLVAGAEAGIFTAGGIGIIARVGVSGAAAANNQSPVALGAGVALGRLRIDYAYRALDMPSGGVHRVGARWGQ